jgi:hypothetical protein
VKKIILFVLAFSTMLGVRNLSALDPVAPKSERAFGFIKVESPLPDSDLCEVTRVDDKNSFKQSFKPAEMVKLPVGNYLLVVKLQNNEWTSSAKISPTEYTKMVVIGYGNLKVTTPNPSTDKVEVYTLDGKLIKSFSSSNPQTLPTGTYNVKIKIGASEVAENNVVILTNTTREIVASN